MKRPAENHQPKEAETSPQIIQAMTASGCQMFRNTRGRTRYGQIWVTYGVGPNGAGDFIGFMPVRVTKEMVGHYLAVFVSAETKGKNSRTDPDLLAKQIGWRDRIIAAGGIAGILDRWEQGRALVMDFYARFESKKAKKAKSQSLASNQS